MLRDGVLRFGQVGDEVKSDDLPWPLGWINWLELAIWFVPLGLRFPAYVARFNVLFDKGAHAWEVVAGRQLLMRFADSSVSAYSAVVEVVNNVLSKLFVCRNVDLSLP